MLSMNIILDVRSDHSAKIFISKILEKCLDELRYLTCEGYAAELGEAHLFAIECLLRIRDTNFELKSPI